MRLISTAFALLLLWAYPGHAQMSCTEELLACTNGCVAGGILGALATKGNSAAATAMQSCSADCETRNATCSRREEEAAIRQQRIDAERAAVEARRQAAEGQKQAIEAQRAARQQQESQKAERVLALAAKEWTALENLHFKPPKNNQKPPAEPKPGAMLAAAKQLEDSDPLMARRLYLQLADRKDDIGKSAGAALRRFRQAPEDDVPVAGGLGAPSPILAALVPAPTMEMLARQRVQAPTLVPSYTKYFKEISEAPASQTWVTHFGEGYSYKHAKREGGALHQEVHVLGGLVQVLAYRKVESRVLSKRVLTAFSVQGDPFNFSEGHEFSFSTTQLVVNRFPDESIRIFPEKFDYDCRVEIAEGTYGSRSGKVSRIHCKRFDRLQIDGTPISNHHGHNISYLYFHDAKVFSEVVNFDLGRESRPDRYKAVEIIKLTESDFRL